MRVTIAPALPLWFACLALACGRSDRTSIELHVGLALLPSEQEVYAEILGEFTRETGIPVRLIAQQYQQLREAVEAESQAGSGLLDIVELDVHLLQPMRGLMVPLDTIAADALRHRDEPMQRAWDAGFFGGKTPAHLFVPHRLNWQALVYDTEAVPTPPDTWEDLLAVARRHPGAIGVKGARYEGMVCDLFPFLWQAGADPLVPESEASLTALRFLSQVAPFLNPAVRSFRENTILQAQERREIVLHQNWPFAVVLLREKGLLGTRVKTAPLPRGPAGRATVLGGGYLGIPKTAPHPLEAGRLLWYLTSPRVQRLFAQRLGWFPVMESAWEGFSAADREAYAGFLAMRGHIRQRPALNDYDRVSRAWQQGFSSLLFDRVPPETVAESVSASLRSQGVGGAQ